MTEFTSKCFAPFKESVLQTFNLGICDELAPKDIQDSRRGKIPGRQMRQKELKTEFTPIFTRYVILRWK